MILLGNPGNRRVQLFADAFRAVKEDRLDIVPWFDYLRDRDALRRHLRPGCRLRLESAGEDFEVEKLLLVRGAEEAEGSGYRCMSAGQAATLDFRRGEILPMHQWYLGWKKTLADIQSDMDPITGCVVMSDPGEIVSMFDKARCHAIFGGADVPTPRLLGIPGSFEELIAMMEGSGCRRVFLKPCHSSSASGVIALEMGTKKLQAFSSVEYVRMNGAAVLFNSLRVRKYAEHQEIRELVNAICRERSIAEAWFPKAGMEGLGFDLRVLVIAGKAAHVVVRQSSSPFTNLHLGNRRGNPDALKERMGMEAWAGAMTTCEKAAAAFPKSLHVAVDLLVAPGMRRVAVAEVNAFGDLLPNLFHEGMDTYTAELMAWKNGPGIRETKQETLCDAAIS